MRRTRRDPGNRLTAVGSALTAGYTGDNLRTWKQGTGTKTYFIYGGEIPVQEIKRSGTVLATNTFGEQGMLSQRSRGSSTSDVGKCAKAVGPPPASPPAPPSLPTGGGREYPVE